MPKRYVLSADLVGRPDGTLMYSVLVDEDLVRRISDLALQFSFPEPLPDMTSNHLVFIPGEIQPVLVDIRSPSSPEEFASIFPERYREQISSSLQTANYRLHMILELNEDELPSFSQTENYQCYVTPDDDFGIIYLDFGTEQLVRVFLHLGRLERNTDA